MKIAQNIIHEFSKENKNSIIIYIIILILTIPLEIYFLPYSLSTFITSLSSKNHTKVLFNNILLLIGVLVLSQLAVSVRTYLENLIVPKFVIFTRKWIYKYIILGHQKKIETLPMGKIVTVLSDFPHIIKNFLMSVVRTYLLNIVSFIFIIGYFFYIHIHLGILQIVTLCIILFICFVFGKGCAKKQKNAYSNYLSMTETVQDTLNNLISIYTSQTEQKELKEHSNKEDKNQQDYSSTLNCTLNIGYFSNSVIIASFIMFNIIIYPLIQNKTISNKQVINIYICEIYYWIMVLRRLQDHISDSLLVAGVFESMTEFLNTLNDSSIKKNTEHNDKNDKNDKKTNVEGNIIELKNVSFAYTDVDIVRNFNLNIKKGERVWLSGHSGTGKSTILKLIMGLLQPDSGDVFIGSKKFNTKYADVQNIRNEITFINQDVKLFNGTVYENMIYGSNVSKNDVNELLQKIQIQIFNKLPNGIDTNVGISGANLSGGQKQVILLVRAYFRNTDIIIMDEPVSAIDVDSMPIILKVISYICKDKTLLVISHNEIIKSIITRKINLNDFEFNSKVF